MVVINETAGDDTTSEQAAGFAATPELTNNWFRSYRRTLAAGESLPAEKHGAPVAIIQGGNEKEKGEVQIKDLILGATLTDTEDRDAYLKKQAQAQLVRKERELVETVRAVLARHNVRWD